MSGLYELFDICKPLFMYCNQINIFLIGPCIVAPRGIPDNGRTTLIVHAGIVRNDQELCHRIIIVDIP